MDTDKTIALAKSSSFTNELARTFVFTAVTAIGMKAGAVAISTVKNKLEARKARKAAHASAE